MAKSNKTSKRPSLDPNEYQPSDEAQSYFDRAEQVYATGNAADALEIYRKAISLDKYFLLARKKIALCELQVNDTQSAIKHLLKYLKSVDKDPEAYAYLAQAYLIAGQAAKARQNVGQALGLVKTADLYFLAATIEEHLNAPLKAIAHYEQGLGLAPNHTGAFLALGILHKNIGNYSRAIEFFENTLSIEPENANAMANLGNVYHAIGLYEQALEYYTKAQHFNQHADIAYNEGLSLQKLSKTVESLNAFKRAVQLDPAHLDAQFQVAESLSEQGKFDDAIEVLDKLVSEHPKYVMPWYAKSQYQQFSEENTEVEKRLLALCRQSKDPEENSLAHFGLAKIYDDTQRYSAAFEHYAIANGQKAKTFKAAAEKQLEEMMPSVVELSDHNFDALQHRFAHATPVFIIGMPRSGTTLLERSICNGNEIASCGEVDYFGPALFRMTNRLGEFGAQNVSDANTSSHLKILKENYLKRIKSLTDTQHYFVDKTPDNFRLVKLFDLMFPNAKFIHCQRHPLDTCLSIFFQNFESIPYSYDLTNIAKYFLRYRAITKENRHNLISKNKWLDVVYEDFVSNKTAVIAQISNFLACEIDANDDIDSQNIPIRTMSKWQARQGIHQSSIGRWELYKDKLGGLQESLASIL